MKGGGSLKNPQAQKNVKIRAAVGSAQEFADKHKPVRFLCKIVRILLMGAYALSQLDT